MAKLYKVNEGKILLGVCTGLGASGGESVGTWRLIDGEVIINGVKQDN